MLLSVCFPQRALQATKATIRLTAEFASGLWNAESEECVAIQRAEIENEGAAVPRLELVAELVDAGVVEDGIMPGDSLTIKVQLTRHHHDPAEDVPDHQVRACVIVKRSSSLSGSCPCTLPPPNRARA